MPRIGFRSIVLLVLLSGALAPVAVAGGGGIPVPSCGWAPAGLVSHSIGDSVKPLKPVWTTQIAPVLSCGYTERNPHLQLGNAAVVVVQFRELQWIRASARRQAGVAARQLRERQGLPAAGPAGVADRTGWGSRRRPQQALLGQVRQRRGARGRRMASTP